MFRMVNRQWNPWQELDEMARTFAPVRRSGNRRPRLDVSEDDEGVTVVAELPGLGPEDIDVTVRGDQVTLQGKPKEEEGENLRCVRRERPSASFERAFRLPFEIDAEKVDAQLTNGVLILRLPKTAAEQPRQIEVHVA